MENLIGKIYDSAKRIVEKGLYEASYITGICWEYRREATHRDFRSRRRQRYPEISNDLLSRYADD